MIKRFCDQCQGEMKEDEPLIPELVYQAKLENILDDDMVKVPVEITFKAGGDLCKNCLAQLIGEEARELRKGGGFSKS